MVIIYSLESVQLTSHTSFLGQKNNPIEIVGCYIPGGRYPLLASAHMTILTAKVAGVPKVIACTPPIRGEIPANTVAAMYLAGADEIYILGGTQAVAAMARGTETIQKVDFLAGPGNAFVAEAKRQLFGEIGIDLFAGPTEVLVVADEHADPYTVATDLLSQAEHGPDTPAVLITNSRDVAEKSIVAVEKLLEILPTRDLAGVSWRDHGVVAFTKDMDDAFKLADEFASEHVQILTESPRDALAKMQHYGALFLGEGTCVSYGDKVSTPILGAGHTILIETVHWNQSRPSNKEVCSIYRRSLGRQVHPHSYVSGSPQQGSQWRAWSSLRTGGSCRAVRGSCTKRRFASEEIPERQDLVDRGVPNEVRVATENMNVEFMVSLIILDM